MTTRHSQGDEMDVYEKKRDRQYQCDADEDPNGRIQKCDYKEWGNYDSNRG
jgi:hypothetical protein